MQYIVEIVYGLSRLGRSHVWFEISHPLGYLRFDLFISVYLDRFIAT